MSSARQNRVSITYCMRDDSKPKQNGIQKAESLQAIAYVAEVISWLGLAMSYTRARIGIALDA